jgi:hypothetical protein
MFLPKIQSFSLSISAHTAPLVRGQRNQPSIRNLTARFGYRPLRRTGILRYVQLNTPFDQ